MTTGFESLDNDVRQIIPRKARKASKPKRKEDRLPKNSRKQ
jgi:hypothetical protein